MASDSKAPLPGKWVVWLFAAASPVAGLAAFYGWASEHPWVAGGVTVIYWAGLFVSSLAQGVWKRLESQWLDRMAQWVDFQLQCLVSGYRRKYLRHLSAECHDLDVKGLTTQGSHALALQRVFVDLEVEPSPASEVPSEPAPNLPPELAEGRHQLQDFLRAGRNLAAIGGPGSGKTTLLRHLALVLSMPQAFWKRRLIPRLPVLLYLRNHAKAIAADGDYALSKAIEESEVVKLQEDRPPAGWWETELRRDRCLILFDGLDEVADPAVRAKVAEWVERAMRRHAGNQFIVTSRPGGYKENAIGGVTVLRVRPFRQEQVRAFVENWYLANELAARNPADPRSGELAGKAAKKGARDLLARLKTSQTLLDLAVNPLLLTMIATVHKYRSELPGRRVELYREICDVFFGKRQAVKGVEDPAGLTPQQKQHVLEPLAFAMMAAGVREFDLSATVGVIGQPLEEVNPKLDGNAFLRMVESSSGLLVESGPGVYRFAHKTFQEYLAAVHVRNHQLVAALTGRLEDEWWHETIRLYVADADATPILQACLEGSRSSVNALVLAAECLAEAKAANPEYRGRLDSLLRDGVEDAARRQVCARVLLSLRLRRLTPLDGGADIDSSLITNAEYQLFLDERGNDALRPCHWQGLVFGAGSGTLPVVGSRLRSGSRVLPLAWREGWRGCRVPVACAG